MKVKNQSTRILIQGLVLVCGSVSISSSFAVDVAKVNGKVITDAQVRAAVAGYNDQQRKTMLADSQSKKDIINNLIEQSLLIQMAEKQKLDQDQAFKDAYAAFRQQYLATRVVSKDVEPKVTTAAAKKYYEENKLKYNTDKVEVAHILVSDEGRAKDILIQAKTDPSKFSDLALQFSKDPTVKNNKGNIGMMTRDSPFVDEFKNAVFKAKAGDIVGPIRTVYGFHVIKVIDRIVGKTMKYEEIDMRVKHDMRQEMIRSYMEQLKKTYPVTIDQAALANIK